MHVSPRPRQSRQGAAGRTSGNSVYSMRSTIQNVLRAVDDHPLHGVQGLLATLYLHKFVHEHTQRSRA